MWYLSFCSAVENMKRKRKRNSQAGGFDRQVTSRQELQEPSLQEAHHLNGPHATKTTSTDLFLALQHAT